MTVAKQNPAYALLGFFIQFLLTIVGDKNLKLSTILNFIKFLLMSLSLN